MKQEEVASLFDQHAVSYDEKWGRLAPLNTALHQLVEAALSNVSGSARILCVGAGTGAEILYLANRFPGWHFTAVEPSGGMLEIFQRKAEEQGILSRCSLHEGFLETLPPGGPFDAATALLVSQFIQDREQRIAFFGGIAARLQENGLLVSSDLAGDLGAADCPVTLDIWPRVLNGSGSFGDEEVVRMRRSYERDLAVLPAGEVQEMIAAGGFERPAQIYQAGMIHAWFTQKSGGS